MYLKSYHGINKKKKLFLKVTIPSIIATNKYQSSSYIKYKIYALLLPAQTVTSIVGFNFLDFNCKQSAKSTSLE